MTQAEVLSQFQRLPAFKGITAADVELYLEIALTAVAGYAPKRVRLKNVPAGDANRYDVPTDARYIIACYVPDTNMKIEFREEIDSETNARTYRLLQVQVPSWIGLTSSEHRNISHGYNTFYSPVHRGHLASEGWGQHDLEFTKDPTIEDLNARQLMALRLYAEAEGYKLQATKSENLSDITDREASGATTTIRRSQSGAAFAKLSMQREEQFKREVARPYWSSDSFGLTEYLWSEYQI